jgi:AAA domain
MTLKTRRPTGAPSWPLILLAGEAKTGKTWSAAEFTGDERVGRSFWVDLGEGCADEYGAVPGADYEIVEHDGTWIDIIGQIAEVRDVARAALEAGEPPVVLVVDSMTAEWQMLSAWTDLRARRSRSNKALLEQDPDAEIDITANYWNDANSRHNRLMNILKTFPGIVVMTALETEKTQFGPNGRPLPQTPKVARPDAQKRLTADATVWVRLALDSPPTIVGLRSVRRTIRPGIDKPKPWPEFSLSKLVFDEIGLAAQKATVRDVPVLNADQVVDGEDNDDPAAVAERKAAKAAYDRSVAQVRKLGLELGFQGKALIKDFADRNNGADINAATSEQLDEYAVELAQALDAQRGPGGGS